MVYEYDIFVSYSHKNRDWVHSCVQAVRNRGFSIWMDQYSIENFHNPDYAVPAGLVASKVALVFATPEYMRSAACQWELRTAYTAAQMRGDPTSRVLVVHRDSEPDDALPWDLRQTALLVKDGPTGAEALCSTLVDHMRGIQEPLGQPPSPTLLGPRAPLLRGDFTGRGREMWMIHSSLHRDSGTMSNPGVVPPYTVLTGLSGVGKTATARFYAEQFRGAYPGGMFWLSPDIDPTPAGTERIDQFRSIATDLGLASRSRPDGANAIAEIESEIARVLREVPFLWIIDSWPGGLGMEALRRWLPPGSCRKPRILILGKTRELAAGAGRGGEVELDAFNPADAFQLLTNLCPPSDSSEEAHARDLVKELEYHPINLAGAAAWVADVRVAGVFALAHARFGTRLPNVSNADLRTGSPDSIAERASVIVEAALKRLGDPGLDLMRLLSVLPPAPVRVEFLSLILREIDRLDDFAGIDRAQDAVRQTRGMSLTLDAKTGLTAHGLVRDAVRRSCGSDARTQHLTTAALQVIGPELPEHFDDQQHRWRLEADIPHARALAGSADDEIRARVATQVARYDEEVGSLESARSLTERVFEFYRTTAGGDSPITAEAAVNLAVAYAAQGAYEKAIAVGETALPVFQCGGAGYDAKLAQAGHQLAADYRQVLRLDDAERVLAQAIAAAQRGLPASAEQYVLCLLEAAGIAAERSDFKRAAEQAGTALDTLRRLLPGDEELAARVHHTLAVALSNLADFSKSREHFEAALDIRQRHPIPVEKAQMLAGLGTVLGKQARYKEAREKLEEALSMFRSRPEVNPATLGDTLSQLAAVRVHDAPGAAKNLLVEALDAAERTFGPEHPQVADVLNELGLACQAQKELDEAARYAERSWSILSKLPEHPRQLAALNVLSSVRLEQGELAEGIRLLELSMEVIGRQLPANHPLRGITVHKLSLACLATHQWVKAEAFHRMAMGFLERAGNVDSSQLHLMRTQYTQARQMAHHETFRRWRKRLGLG